MIPEKIKIKYQSFDNPYRKLFFDQEEYVACDFSDLIPSWKIELSDNCSIELIKKSLKFAEERNYYSFYTVFSRESFDRYITIFEDTGYIPFVEEIVIQNEKSINLLFWEWLLETTNQEEDVLIIKWMLLQSRRNYDR